MFDPGVERALAVALDAHSGQLRRGSDDPYVVHPLHVALFLARLNHDSLVIQAGLLHDVVEDCDGWTLDRVHEEFGAEVASVVGEVTEDKSLSWAERKEWGISVVSSLSPAALVIKGCDKLHNLESLARSLRESDNPDTVWGRFRGGREGTLDVAERLVASLSSRLDGPLAVALRRALETVQGF